MKKSINEGFSYILLIAPFSCIIRVPSRMYGGMVRFSVKKSDWNKAFTALAHFYGHKGSSISSIELFATEIKDHFDIPFYREKNEENLIGARDAYKGSVDVLKAFNLWDWTGTGFVLIRPAVNKPVKTEGLKHDC